MNIFKKNKLLNNRKLQKYKNKKIYKEKKNQ